MKFRCRMSETLAMRDFTNVVNAIAKMSKLCVLVVSSSTICFTVMDERNPLVWAELSKDHFFDEYTFVGAAREQNLIHLEVDALMLSKSMTTLKTAAKSVRIKLTDKQQPCLTLEIELPSITDSWQCTHDVPVRIVPRKECPAYKAPTVPDCDIAIDLPQMKHIRNVVERMKNMSPHLSIIANNAGMFVLKVETDRATVSTHFRDLRVCKENITDKEEITATVDLKKILTFLAWDSVRPENVQCNISHEAIVYLHLNLEDNIKINYFVPSINI